MDRTEQYIKMSDCFEIQDRIPMCDVGDYFATKGYGGWWFIDIMDDPYAHTFDRVIWLPRQDQLQEMLVDAEHDCGSCPAWSTESIVPNSDTPMWATSDMMGYATDWYDSPDKALLAFYMKVRHGKVWNGEAWV